MNTTDSATVIRGPSWRAVFLFWTAFGIVESVKAYATWDIRELAPSWAFVFIGNMPWWYTWALLTPAAFWVARRFPLDGGRWLRNVGVHAIGGAVIASAHLLLEGWIYFTTTSHFVIPDLTTQWQRFFNNFFMTDLLTYGMVVGGWHAVTLHGRYREAALREARAETRATRLQLGLAEARMHALRMELNPHFLFNTLNAIVALVRRRENARADEMLVRLGDLLRATLAPSEETEIPLRREVALLSLYLDIERVRFADRLTVDLDISRDVEDALVPPLVLQPLVENAIRHGISRSPTAGQVTISARRDDESLLVDVSDTGPGPNAASDVRHRGTGERSGVGLANVRGRLREMYGDTRAGVVLARDTGGGTTARLSLPFHVNPAPIGAAELEMVP